MYLDAVASETSIPSVSNSTWIRGAPYRGYSQIYATNECANLGIKPWPVAMPAIVTMLYGGYAARNWSLRDDNNRRQNLGLVEYPYPGQLRNLEALGGF